MSELAPSTLFRLHPEVRYTLLDDEAVVIRQAHSEVLVLNEVGGRVLQLIDGGRTAGEIVDTIEQEYDAERATIAADVATYCDELLAGGVIERAA